MLVLLAVVLAAGIAHFVIDYLCVGCEEMEVVSPASGPAPGFGAAP